MKLLFIRNFVVAAFTIVAGVNANEIKAGAISREICTSQQGSPLAEYVDLATARSIDIRSDWVGFSPIGATSAHYALSRSDAGYVGYAEFSVGKDSDSRRRHFAKEKIMVPMHIVQRFFDVLGKAPLMSGKYIPTFHHTDDYPFMRIQVMFAEGDVVLSTNSQGEDHSPWKVSSGSSECVSSSGIPVAAFDVLSPYLKRDTQSRLNREAMKEAERLAH